MYLNRVCGFLSMVLVMEAYFKKYFEGDKPNNQNQWAAILLDHLLKSYTYDVKLFYRK